MTMANIVTGSELEANQHVNLSVPENFSVRDAATANWLVRKIVEARAYGKHVREWAARELRRAQNEEKFFLYRYGQQLEDWARQQVDREDGRRKSLKLPAGTIGFRTYPPHLEVKDEQELLRWCKANLPVALAVTEMVLKTVVKNHIASTGELPIGAEVVGGGEKFFIK
jgi:hypothetical protein